MTAIPDELRSWAEIDLAALRHNLAYARSLVGENHGLMAVLKADAYGHGLRRIAAALESENLSYLGLANTAEALRLHRAGIQTPIFLLGPSFPAEREAIVEHGFVPCLSDLEEARHFAGLAQSHNRRLQVHLALDTGMGRGGFLVDQLKTALEVLVTLSGLEIVGVGSHLSSADEDRAFTLRQMEIFEQQLSLCRKFFEPQFIHLSNSAGLLDYPLGPCNLVRPGLILYGVSPLPEHQQQLRPVMRFMSRVSLVRELPAGATVSYGHSFRSERTMRTATVGIGYGDGYPRSLSGQGARVKICGKDCPLLGRVTMDQIVVDVSELPELRAGEPVELFGQDLLVSELAKLAGTIPWEILTGITTRVERIFLNS